MASGRILLLACLGLAACGPSAGPEPIVYDREACAHCRMLISDPHFAAQLRTADGFALSFDDPGCLLAFLAARSPEVREIWFHHAREDRWLAGGEVAFAPVAHTPMGYGLAAVEAGAPGAMTLTDAQSRVAAIPGRAAP